MNVLQVETESVSRRETRSLIFRDFIVFSCSHERNEEQDVVKDGSFRDHDELKYQ